MKSRFVLEAVTVSLYCSFSLLLIYALDLVTVGTRLAVSASRTVTVSRLLPPTADAATSLTREAESDFLKAVVFGSLTRELSRSD